MAWTAPRTWVAGETVTAAVMNTHVRDNLKALGDPWTAFTPTVTAGSGTFTSVAAGLRYIQAGKTTMWTAVVTITTVGTAAGTVNFTLPVAPASPPLGGANASIGQGRASGVTGKALQVFYSAGVASAIYYDNTTAIVAGASLLMSGSYEGA